jgi:hypothetical protein
MIIKTTKYRKIWTHYNKCEGSREITKQTSTTVPYRLEDVGIFGRYSRITSIKSPSFCTRTFSASITNLTASLLQSRDCSCYVRRRTLVPPPLWLQKRTDLLNAAVLGLNLGVHSAKERHKISPESRGIVLNHNARSYVTEALFKLAAACLINRKHYQII